MQHKNEKAPRGGAVFLRTALFWRSRESNSGDYITSLLLTFIKEKDIFWRMIIQALLIAAFLLPTLNIPAQESAPAPHATVYVYSYKHIRTLGKAAFSVYVDNMLLAKLDGARYFMVKLEPGTHSFHLKEKRRGGVEMEFKAGEVYYIRMEKREGDTVGPSALVLMPKEQGTFDIKQMKPANKKDIKDGARVSTEPPNSF